MLKDMHNKEDRRFNTYQYLLTYGASGSLCLVYSPFISTLMAQSLHLSGMLYIIIFRTWLNWLLK